MIMVFGIPSFREALRKLGLGDGAPEDEIGAVAEGEISEAPPEEAVSTPQEAPAGVTPASADWDMPFPDDEGTKTASPNSWSSPTDSRPLSGAQEIPVEDLSIGIFNALSDGIGSLVKTTSSAGSLAAAEARLRVKAIRSESASEFRALRKFATKLVRGTKDEKSNQV